MTAPDGSVEKFLVEWYDPVMTAGPLQQTAGDLEAGAALVGTHGMRAHLEIIVAAPTDDVLYGVFTADAADAVLSACRYAGRLPDRITAGIRTHVATSPLPGTARRASRGDETEVPLPSG